MHLTHVHWTPKSPQKADISVGKPRSQLYDLIPFRHKLCLLKSRKLISLWLSLSNDGHDNLETSENDLKFTASIDIWRDRVPEVEHAIFAAQERRK